MTTADRKLDNILDEMRAIRAILEGLMDPANPHTDPSPDRPFGADGIDTPDGKMSVAEFEEKFSSGRS